MNLSKRIIVYVSLLVLLISAGLGVTALVFGDRIITAQAEEALLAQAEDGARLVSEMVSLRLEVLQEVANRATVRGMVWDEQVRSLGTDIRRLGYLDFGIVTPDGNVRYISDGTTTNLSDRDYIQRALAGERNISDVIVSRVTHEPVLMYAVPIVLGDQVQGALIARRDGNALSLITDTMGFGETGYAYAINRQGTVVAHSNRDYVIDQFAPIAQAQEDPEMIPLAATFGTIIVVSLKDRTGEAVVTMDQMEKLVQIQQDSVQETAGKFEGIDQAVQQMQLVIQKLNTSGRAMDQKKLEMIRVMENLSAISEENAAGTQQVSASVEEQTAAMEEIARASETLAQLAEEMNRGIMRFTY